jgi:hypothetical protein
VGSTNYIIFRNAEFFLKNACDKEQIFVKEDEESALKCLRIIFLEMESSKLIN